jgi:hypothetical protein
VLTGEFRQSFRQALLALAASALPYATRFNMASARLFWFRRLNERWHVSAKLDRVGGVALPFSEQLRAEASFH